MMHVNDAQKSHHEDIVGVALTDLALNKDQEGQIKKLIEKCLDELKTLPQTQGEMSKYADEIRQLEETEEQLNEAKGKIEELLESLDPNRTSTGSSMSIQNCEKKKRKLDVAFSRTPTPERSTKKSRLPSYAQTPRKVTVTDSSDMEVTSTNSDALVSAALNAEPNNLAVIGPALLVPFLPPTAAKLLLVVDGRFDSIEWYPSSTRVPLNKETSGLGWSQWTTSRVTKSNHFVLQTYNGFAGLTQRIVAVEPVTEEGTEAEVVPLVKTVNHSEALKFLNLLAEIEESSGFDYEAVWRVLCKE
jgi:hypothetical protein